MQNKHQLEWARNIVAKIEHLPQPAQIMLSPIERAIFEQAQAIIADSEAADD